MNDIAAKIAIMNHFLHYDEDKFKQFDDTVRNPRNCVTNYAIKRKDVNLSLLKSKDQMIKQSRPIHTANDYKSYTKQLRSSLNMDNYSQNNYFANVEEIDYDSDGYGLDDIYYCNYEEMNDEMSNCDSNYLIRIDHLNLLNGFNKLKCPFCEIKLQCIPMNNDSNQISFICFNYPKCKYPINYPAKDYHDKFIWKNVCYIGPIQDITNNDNENDQMIKSCLFDDKQRDFRKWKRYQIKKSKQLKNTIEKKWNKYRERKLDLQVIKPKLIKQFEQQQRLFMTQLRMKVVFPKLSGMNQKTNVVDLTTEPFVDLTKSK